MSPAYESLALALWNSLPYDNATGVPVCPTLEDARRALQAAVEKAAVEVSPLPRSPESYSDAEVAEQWRLADEAWADVVPPAESAALDAAFREILGL